MFSTAFQILYVTGATGLFTMLALVTRTRGRRLLGALASVAVFTALSGPLDRFAGEHGWWTFPAYVNPPNPPLLVYIGQSLIFVGAVSLAGWRVHRRWGWSGTVALAGLVCGAGFARDMTAGALFPQVITFGPAPAAQLADLAAWAVVAAVGLGVTRLIGGSVTCEGGR